MDTIHHNGLTQVDEGWGKHEWKVGELAAFTLINLLVLYNVFQWVF